ncbi:hypothetical protein L6452_39289 [Arctium lappa]|uniref:Uncharacterized protein n=1 Tax=Arctium lappa TaxID=4217 RepID=A0ACB8XW04_ARCLA|nr:hypothetical protein L6452_39289 [Arctium lappa]
MEDRYSAVVDLQGDSKQAAEFSAKNLNKNIMLEVENKDENELVDVVREGYLTTNSGFLKEDVNGGTCCVTALIRKGNLIVSNAGDCRAVMSRNGVAEALTTEEHMDGKANA